MKKMSEFRLNVHYSANKHPNFGLDSTIRGIVGRPEVGAGTDLVHMIRDMDFVFKDENSAKKALTRLKKQKIQAEIVAA